MITRLIVFLNLAAFAWEVYSGGTGILTGSIPENAPLYNGVLSPLSITQGHEYYRLVTAAFLHASALHVAVNMIALYSFGRFVERQAGPLRFIAIYLVSLFASSFAVVVFSSPQVPTLGASGAIFGLFGALFAIGLKHGKDGMNLVRANIGVLVVNLLITFAIPLISKQAHIGGLVVGFLFTYAIYWPPKPVRARVVDAATGVAYESELQLPGEGAR
ncbi:MAG: rhomboid family intramembrane serine protease [Candidatus Eremiobacteraeota bacterium]|nr:rhomboid family intramembrane serine protease [Candidatus Eremiobacteraeota bacterium]